MTVKTWQPKIYGIQEKQYLSGKFTAIQAYLKKKGRHQIKNLTLYIKQLEKQNQKITLKVNRMKNIIKMRAEINELEMKKAIEKINETKSRFFEKTNEIDKLLARLIKKNRERTQIKLEMK